MHKSTGQCAIISAAHLLKAHQGNANVASTTHKVMYSALYSQSLVHREFSMMLSSGVFDAQQCSALRVVHAHKPPQMHMDVSLPHHSTCPS
jgi:hypothetical protein